MDSNRPLPPPMAPSPSWVGSLLHFLASHDHGFGHGDLLSPPRLTRAGQKLLVEIDAPGVAPEDLEVVLEPGVLVVSGQRRPRETKEEDDPQRERRTGWQRRETRLPLAADAQGAAATLAHGVLTVTVPLRQPAGARRIPVSPA